MFVGLVTFHVGNAFASVALGLRIVGELMFTFPDILTKLIPSDGHTASLMPLPPGFHSLREAFSPLRLVMFSSPSKVLIPFWSCGQLLLIFDAAT